MLSILCSLNRDKKGDTRDRLLDREAMVIRACSRHAYFRLHLALTVKFVGIVYTV